MTATPLPRTATELTSAWLGDALGAPGAARSVQVVETHSGTTGRVRLRVDWERHADLPEALFVKLPPTDPTSRAMVESTGMGRREAHFYRDLAGEVPVRVPRPLWSGWSEDGSDYVMVLEDLATAGCRFPTPDTAEVSRVAEGLVDAFAQLHAHFWGSPHFGGDLAWVDAPMRSEWGPILVEAGLEQFGAQMSADWGALARLYLEHTAAFDDLLDVGPHTLVHGDAHLGNLFVDGPRVGFLDWACTAHAPGMRDVAYFLTNSLPTDVRRGLERPLIDRYRARLAEAGGPARSADDVWRDYRRLAAYSWVAATTTAAAGSRMQSVEIGRRAVQRTDAAVRDLGTLELLLEELGVATA